MVHNIYKYPLKILVWFENLIHLISHDSISYTGFLFIAFNEENVFSRRQSKFGSFSFMHFG